MASVVEKFNPEVQIAKVATAKPKNRFAIAFGLSLVIFDPINIIVYLACLGILFFIIGFSNGFVFLWAVLVYFIVFPLGAYLFLTVFHKVA